MRKHYTVASANRTLPYVRSIVEEVRERYRVVQEQGRAHKALPRTNDAGRADLKAEIRDSSDRIRACLDELHSLGLEMKDYELGLVDFPAELEGRTIHLCWRLGEDRIGFWHEVDAGFAGRKPVPDDPDWPPAPQPDSPPPAKERPRRR